MTHRGIVKGRTIELEEPLPYPEGQPVNVSVEPLEDDLPLGSPALILKAMREPPHLTKEDVDALERAIEEGKIPAR